MVAALALALPAGAAAKQAVKPRGPVDVVAIKQCAQEKSDVGKRAFRKKYGAKHAMRTCVKRTRPQVAAVLDAAVQGCQQELTEEGPAEFLDDYLDDIGTVDAAMGECVVETVDELLHPGDYADDDEDDVE